MEATENLLRWLKSAIGDGNHIRNEVSTEALQDCVRAIESLQQDLASAKAEAAEAKRALAEFAGIALDGGSTPSPDPGKQEGAKCVCKTNYIVCSHVSRGHSIFQVDDDCMHCGHKEGCHAAEVKP